MTDTPTQVDADFLTVLSSELIAEVMEDYFNKKMYRQRVKVVDLQPQGSGYAFSLAFVKDDVRTYKLAIDSNSNASWIPIIPVDVDKDVEIADNTHFAEVFRQRAQQHGLDVHPIMEEVNKRIVAQHDAIQYSMDKDILESSGDVAYTAPIPNGRDTKGKFTKKVT